MLHCRGKFSFYHWLAVSLLLHSSIILPFILTGLHAPDQNKHNNHNKLLIELFGMVANRQQEGKRGGTGVPQQNKRVLQLARPHGSHQIARPRIIQQNERALEQNITRDQVNRPRQSPDTYKTVATDSPVHVEKADDKPNPTEQGTGPSSVSTVLLPAVSGTAGGGGYAGGGGQQRQQSIKYEDQVADEIREYLAKLAKRLQANLVYPEEVRKNKVEGISTIAFTITESGDIKGNSLRVQKSSGYPALDSNALKSARVGAPFEKPPKELNVSIAVSFTVEMARSRANQASRR